MKAFRYQLKVVHHEWVYADSPEEATELVSVSDPDSVEVVDYEANTQEREDR